MGLLISMLDSNDETEAAKGVSAVAAMVRNMQKAQQSFLDNGKAEESSRAHHYGSCML